MICSRASPMRLRAETMTTWKLLIVMHRALLRGLVIPDRYVSDPRHNARVVEPWISIVARCCGRGAGERVAMHPFPAPQAAPAAFKGLCARP